LSASIFALYQARRMKVVLPTIF